ncbi:TonB-dependent receptor [Microbulbifer pacificus]|uniref:TonB-dependent receptor n=1 Tax=Microbulbifer pacificus TaxID=407164 RepID=UPI000CF55D5D|nr:TonB-dependent receptor [Microbulbifer pacificus]
MHIRRSLLALAISASLSGQVVLAADTTGGTLKGQVINHAGEALAGAEITVTHAAKGVTRRVTSDEKGQYNLRNLPVGEYIVRFEKDGFGTAQATEVRVNVGEAVVYDGRLVPNGEVLEVVEVTGSRLRPIDTGSSTAGVVITQDRLEALPVNTGFEAMAQLAPSVVAPGGSSFNGASSFGGASSAENGYYLNGLNVANIKTGLGSISLPWEAIRQTQIKTGGIAPEFGGALGGIVNAASKSGSNDFEFGSQLRMDPDSLRKQHGSIRNAAGEYAVNSEQNGMDFQEAQFWASGPIVKDKAFFYALFSPRQTDDTWATGSSYYDRTSEEDRWFVNVEWFIDENHAIDFTSINNEKNGSYGSYAYSPENNTIGDYKGQTKFRSGGKVSGAHYNGRLTDDLTLDVTAGRTQETVYNSALNSLPYVEDCRATCVSYSNHSDSTIINEDYIRDQLRLDLSYDLLDHQIKLGIDYTHLDVFYESTPNGPGDAQGWWKQRIATANDPSKQPEGTVLVERRIRTRGTDSDVSSTAFYIQDAWQVTDELVLNLGGRYEQFENTVTGGDAYVDNNGFSPRISAVWDFNGDGDSKLFATYGRYYQPVSANMNITQGSFSRETFDYYTPGATDANGRVTLNADGSPDRGDLLHSYVRQQGIVEPALIATGNLEGMYADEFTLGMETLVFDDMVLGVRGVYRDLKRSIEDSDVSPILSHYLEANGIEDNVGQSSYYVVLNPGEDVNISYDFDGDGVVDNISLSSDELALPKARRRYLALETNLRGQVTDQLFVDASYTWSHNYGNTEGLVRTDNDQADPGWTTSYDYADLMDHSYGDLPNDHRHAFKLNGFYDLTDNLTLGLVGSLVSGRPKNYFSVHPVGEDSCAEGSPWSDCISQYYGEVSFYDENGEPAPRGSKGNLPWSKQLDLSLAYTMPLFEGDLLLKGTVYNILNDDSAIDINEIRTIQLEGGGTTINPDYGLTESRPTARYFSLIARYDF